MGELTSNSDRGARNHRGGGMLGGGWRGPFDVFTESTESTAAACSLGVTCLETTSENVPDENRALLMPCSVALVKQESRAACILNYSFGCHPSERTVWTQNCRGTFQCDGERKAIQCGFPPGKPAYSCNCNAKRTSSNLCDLTRWLRSTANNTAARKLIVVNGWVGTGIGHSILASARWLEVIRRSDRAIRFAFCVPAALLWAYPLTPSCDQSDLFDLHRYIAFRGVPPSLRASAAEMASVTRQLFKPNCTSALAAIRSDEPVVSLHKPRPCPVATSCLRKVVRQRWLRTALPRCSVGLHLRSLALDDAKCNAFGGALSPSEAARCSLRHGNRRPERTCQTAARDRREFPLSVAGCPGGARRVAVTDHHPLYASTRPLGWTDAGTHAVQTWSNLADRARSRASSQRTGDSNRSLGLVATINAWFTIARCKHAVVAPVRSAFSATAADAAGVPIFACCADVKLSAETQHGTNSIR